MRGEACLTCTPEGIVLYCDSTSVGFPAECGAMRGLSERIFESDTERRASEFPCRRTFVGRKPTTIR